MAGGMDLGTSSKGKKPLDAQINLVPFIDLMAVTISFLIMTAAWTQIGRIQVAQGGAGPGEDLGPPPVVVRVTPTDVQVVLADEAKPRSFKLEREAKGLQLNAFRSALREVRSASSTTRVSVRAEDDVRYEDLVQVIDGCISAGLSDVSVET